MHDERPCVLRPYTDDKPAESLEQFLSFDLLQGAVTSDLFVFFVDNAHHCAVPAHGNAGCPCVIAHTDVGARPWETGID
jgi:hypothetical protein